MNISFNYKLPYSLYYFSYFFHRVALVVLLNVARHDHLAGALTDSIDDAADAVVDLMQMFRDKRSIFILAGELLARCINANNSFKVSICINTMYQYLCFI